jgi:hypothetical protein
MTCRISKAFLAGDDASFTGTSNELPNDIHVLPPPIHILFSRTQEDE